MLYKLFTVNIIMGYIKSMLWYTKVVGKIYI